MVNEIKINRIREVRALNSLKKKSTSEKKDFGKELGAISKNEIDVSQNISGISNNLYTLQEDEENFKDEKKDIEYGENLLNLLNEYRRKLILQQTTIKELEQIKNSIQLFQLSAINEKLKNILKEIELRAKIELAKRGVIK